MSLFSRIAGVVGSFFQVGGPNGPGLANDGGSGNLGAYNSTQGAYVNIRGADPVGVHDLLTLGYFNINLPGLGPPFAMNVIPILTVVTVLANKTMLQAGDLLIQGDLVLGTGDICWTD